MSCRHAVLIEALGSFMDGLPYDASEDTASGDVERALVLQPDSKTIMLECAAGPLLPDDGSERARNLLVRDIAMDSRDAAGAIERLGALQTRRRWIPDLQQRHRSRR